MTQAELIALAAPPCHLRMGRLAPECGSPVERVETRWELNGDGDWVPGPTFLVCAQGHRVPVEPL